MNTADILRKVLALVLILYNPASIVYKFIADKIKPRAIATIDESPSANMVDHITWLFDKRPLYDHRFGRPIPPPASKTPSAADYDICDRIDGTDKKKYLIAALGSQKLCQNSIILPVDICEYIFDIYKTMPHVPYETTEISNRSKRLQIQQLTNGYKMIKGRGFYWPNQVVFTDDKYELSLLLDSTSDDTKTVTGMIDLRTPIIKRCFLDSKKYDEFGFAYVSFAYRNVYINIDSPFIGKTRDITLGGCTFSIDKIADMPIDLIDLHKLSDTGICSINITSGESYLASISVNPCKGVGSAYGMLAVKLGAGDKIVYKFHKDCKNRNYPNRSTIEPILTKILKHMLLPLEQATDVEINASKLFILNIGLYDGISDKTSHRQVCHPDSWQE